MIWGEPPTNSNQLGFCLICRWHYCANLVINGISRLRRPLLGKPRAIPTLKEYEDESPTLFQVFVTYIYIPSYPTTLFLAPSGSVNSRDLALLWIVCLYSSNWVGKWCVSSLETWESCVNTDVIRCVCRYEIYIYINCTSNFYLYHVYACMYIYIIIIYIYKYIFIPSSHLVSRSIEFAQLQYSLGWLIPCGPTIFPFALRSLTKRSWHSTV